jgi:hypothetical protein
MILEFIGLLFFLGFIATPYEIGS